MPKTFLVGNVGNLVGRNESMLVISSLRKKSYFWPLSAAISTPGYAYSQCKRCTPVVYIYLLNGLIPLVLGSC